MTREPHDTPMILSPDTRRGGGDPITRTPPGQTLTNKWPVLHYGDVPVIDPQSWTLRIHGLVENEITLDWQQFNALPKVTVLCDIHCVTHWSKLDNRFTGVPTRTLIEMAKPLPEARFIMQHAAGDPGRDWTTNLPLDEFIEDDCILATHHNGEPLTADHGGPVRGLVPKLYFWKSAKWITSIELRDTDTPGFWEINGYHMHGDPWHEQRFGW